MHLLCKRDYTFFCSPYYRPEFRETNLYIEFPV